MAGENISATEGLLNPAVPTVQEDTKPQKILGIAHSITQPAAPKSGEYALQGLSTILGETIHGLDTAQKIGLDEQLRKGIESMKSEEIEKLKAAGQAVGQLTGGPGPADVKKPIPTEVADVPKQLELLKEARANGKMSLSEYDGKLRRFLSDMRNNNPGYRDYIDDQGKKIIGYDPANAEIKQRLEDLNAIMAHKMDERKFIIQAASGPEYSNIPGVDKFIEGVIAGKYGMADWVRFKAPTDKLRTEAEDARRREVVDKQTMSIDVDRVGAAKVNQIMHSVAGPTGQTGEQLMQDVRDGISGKKKFTPQQVAEMQANGQVILSKTEEGMMAWGSEPVTLPDGHVTTRRTAMGEADFKAKVKEAITPLKNYLDLAGNEKIGLAGMQQRFLDIALKSKQVELISNKDIGQTTLAIKALEGYLPKDMVEEVAKQLLQNTIFNEEQNAFLALKKVRVATEPNSPIGDIIAQLQKAGVTKREIYDTVIGYIHDAEKPDMPQEAKENIIWNFVNKKNQGLLTKFEGDVVVKDETGRDRSVPAKYGYFFTVFNPNISKEVEKSTSTGLKRAYKDRAEEWFGISYGQDLKTMEAIESTGALEFKFNHETHRYSEFPVRVKVTDPTDVSANQVNLANEIIRKLNYGLDRMDKVLKASDPAYDPNSSVERFMLSHMHSIGYDPNKPGAMRSIVDALKKSLTPGPEDFGAK